MYILIPDPDRIEVVNIFTNEPALGDNEDDRIWTLRRYVFEVLLTDGNLGEPGYDLYTMVGDIRDAVDTAYDKGHAYISMPQTHIDRLKKVIDKPAARRNPAGMSQLVAFMQAIKEPVKALPDHLDPDKIADAEGAADLEQIAAEA